MASTETERLEELILHIAAKMAVDGHRGRGRIKLAKLLWAIDTTAYGKWGRSVSGTEYTIDEHGPAPDGELLATRDLEAAGDFEWENPWRNQQIPIAKRPARREVFTVDEWTLIDEIIDGYRDWTGKQMRDRSHRHPAWAARSMGDRAPLYSIHMSESGPTEADLDRAEVVAREQGWI